MYYVLLVDIGRYWRSIHIAVQKFVFGKILFLKKICYTLQGYSKNSNIINIKIYIFCDGTAESSASLLQSSVSHDPTKI